ncbi:LysR family transcriptional regulator [Pseudomonas mosselii]|uniref:LysR family transcriptional regulator n=1 Tax=Pseudomonas mosselii TaxID=78327 RepID=UPI001E5164F9|nr:LysR family transcriptional regulator [Pseudomonas mosselii]MCL8299540.1 LysR family transcriptional regulator [Pseudomonas mosselii]MCL8339923.1 LysR family transcriptional regulator [Pseudomonas mosselii]WJR30014.1 LysR family transcriptional regulator [Pseudomonas mosselii]
MDLLNAIRSFIKVVEAGSIAGGARNLGLSPAAVSQNLARLETHLQVRLLTRTTRSMALTPPGSLYYERVRHIERDLAQAELAVITPDSEPQGRLCIASTSAFGRHVLAPLIPAFSARYPLLSIELVMADRKVNHAREDVDVSLRITPQLEDHLLARHIARIPFICCAAPGYLARAGLPATPEALHDHSCLVFRYPVDGRFLPWGFMRDGMRFEARFGRVLISDDIDALTQMALNDGGITRLAEFVVRPHLDAGRLVPLFEFGDSGQAYAQTEPMDIYLCLADRFALTTKVRVFMEYLQQCLGQQWCAQA